MTVSSVEKDNKAIRVHTDREANAEEGDGRQDVRQIRLRAQTLGYYSKDLPSTTRTWHHLKSSY